MSEVLIGVPEKFASHLDAAALRFGSQHPNITMHVDGTTCRLTGDGADDPALRSRFLHSVYREKIFTDTLPMRLALIETLRA
jgi:hypothetical protein